MVFSLFLSLSLSFHSNSFLVCVYFFFFFVSFCSHTNGMRVMHSLCLCIIEEARRHEILHRFWYKEKMRMFIFLLQLTNTFSLVCVCCVCDSERERSFNSYRCKNELECTSESACFVSFLFSYFLSRLILARPLAIHSSTSCLIFVLSVSDLIFSVAVCVTKNNIAVKMITVSPESIKCALVTVKTREKRDQCDSLSSPLWVRQKKNSLWRLQPDRVTVFHLQLSFTYTHK